MKIEKVSRKLLMALAMSGLLVVGGSNLAQHNVSASHVHTHKSSKYLSNKYYYRSNPRMVYTRSPLNVYRNPQRTRLNYHANAGTYYHIKGVNNRYHDLETNNRNYMSANKYFVKKTSGYQNPKRYYQVSYGQVPGAKNIPPISVGWEGMRTKKVANHLGVPDYHNEFTYGDKYAVENFQRNHHLKANGVVNYKTWRKMGFSKYQWNHLDNAIPKTSFSRTNNRKDRINAGLNRIKKYLGGVWISGTSSSPAYKDADCSGLAMQYLMAGGLHSKWIPMRHAEPGNEWDSQKMWADPKLKWIPFSQRQRGDLIFFRDPSTYNIWHVGIMTSSNTMIDSWPPYIQYHSIFNSEHGIIAGVKRPFI